MRWRSKPAASSTSVIPVRFFDFELARNFTALRLLLAVRLQLLLQLSEFGKRGIRIGLAAGDSRPFSSAFDVSGAQFGIAFRPVAARLSSWPLIGASATFAGWHPGLVWTSL